MMGTIEDLERKVQSLSDELAAAKTSLEEARIAACPIKVGDIVTNEKWPPRKVSRIEAKYSTVYLHGYKQKVNGEWGGRESYIGIVAKAGGYGWTAAGKG